MSHKSQRRAIAKLEALYARLPTVACRGRCFEACGPIIASTLEVDRMHAAHPARRRLRMLEDVTCSYLTADHRCSVYAVRPLICRVWGVVKRYSCMHGCLPDRWLSDHEFVEIAKAIERIAGPLRVSTLEGDQPFDDTFQDLDLTSVSPAKAEELAEKTRTLRVLHDGRIYGVREEPTAGPGTVSYTDLDELRRQRREARGK